MGVWECGTIVKLECESAEVLGSRSGGVRERGGAVVRECITGVWRSGSGRVFMQPFGSVRVCECVCEKVGAWDSVGKWVHCSVGVRECRKVRVRKCGEWE